MDNRKKKILNHPLIKNIINYLNLNENQINSGINIFWTIIEEQENLNELDFITKVKIYDDHNIVGISVPNGKFKKEVLRKKYHQLDQITWMNPDLKFDKRIKTNIKEWNDNLFFWDIEEAKKNDRSPLAKWFKDFFSYVIYKNDMNFKKNKGFYLHGGFGLGKTSFLNAFANYLIKNKKTVIYIKSLDLLNYLKSNFDNKNSVNNIINKLKNVDYLLIDDIGSETASEWFVFNILYHVLNHRLINNKMCCFTSNFDYQSLGKKYEKNKDIDKMKINRLIDQIETLTVEIKIYGDNIKKII